MIKRYLLAVSLITQNSSVASSLNKQPRTPPSPPQQQPQKPDDADVVKITTNLVQVDAVVFDKNGKPVTDLTADEVQVFEDNKPQKITHFVYNMNGTEPVNHSVNPTMPRVNRTAYRRCPRCRERQSPATFTARSRLWLTTSVCRLKALAFLRRTLKKFVDEQIQPGDLVAIIRTAGGAGVLQQFTSDKRQLHAAIERVKYNLMGAGGCQRVFRGETARPQNSGRKGGFASTAENFREEVFSVGTLGTLRYVVNGLREYAGA